MKVDMAQTPSEFERLTEELRICRLELAQVRDAQEQAAETSMADHRRLKRINTQLERLAEAAHTHLDQQHSEARPGRVSRVGARLVGRHQEGESQDEAALLRDSAEFVGAWYLIQHPEVVASGESAVQHYLHHGAAAGFDPGPDFNTRRYLRTHPEVAESGVNPLVHFLTAGSSRAGTHP